MFLHTKYWCLLSQFTISNRILTLAQDTEKDIKCQLERLQRMLEIAANGNPTCSYELSQGKKMCNLNEFAQNFQGRGGGHSLIRDKTCKCHRVPKNLQCFFSTYQKQQGGRESKGQLKSFKKFCHFGTQRLSLCRTTPPPPKTTNPSHPTPPRQMLNREPVGETGRGRMIPPRCQSDNSTLHLNKYTYYYHPEYICYMVNLLGI